jgi:hypothetical protein
VPEISRFLGIIIAMFYREHGPPHLHAFYSGHRITVEIESGNVTGHFRGEHWHTSRNGGNFTNPSSWRTGGWPAKGNQ